MKPDAVAVLQKVLLQNKKYSLKYMKSSLFYLILFLLSVIPEIMLAQQENIPLESWRTHFSYQNIQSIAIAGERVYAAGDYGLFYFDREDKSATTISVLDFLSDAGIANLYYHPENDILVIAYRNGNLDIVEQGEIYNLPTILEASLPGDRAINDVQFSGNITFLATDFGISVLNLQAREINESYFNLSRGGEPVEVNQLAIWNDSLFAITAQGLIGNALQGSNLSDFNTWKHFSATEMPVPERIEVLTGSAQGLLAGVDEEGLFVYAGGKWTSTAFRTGSFFRSLQAVPDGILISMANGIYLYNQSSGKVNPISSALIQSPYQAAQDNAGSLWIADGANGLVSNFEGGFQSVIPNGPLADVPVSLYAGEGKIVALFNKTGGTSSHEEDGPGGFSVFSQGSWQNYSPRNVPEMPEIEGFSDITYNQQNQRYYFSSLKSGLLEWDPASSAFRQFMAGMANVSLDTNQGGATPVSTLAVDQLGQLWMVQSGTQMALHRYNPMEESWQGYLEDHTQAGNAAEILILQNGDKWLRLKGDKGIFIFNEEKGQSRLLGKGINSGGLTNANVTEMELDLEGQLWLGLQQGVNYFPNPYAVLGEAPVNAVFPVYEGRALLNFEEITTLAIDGGNRKWMGTPAGLWVFGDYGDTLHYRFSTANSPLPDNFIRDLAVDQQSGEVFIATQKGMVSFRSGATEAGFEHASAIKIFPNPINPGYEGKVGITGLARDVVVKITDVSGRLVKELAAEGGTATWDLTNTQGRRPASGVYLIFSSSADGTETLSGKLAIVN